MKKYLVEYTVIKEEQGSKAIDAENEEEARMKFQSLLQDKLFVEQLRSRHEIYWEELNVRVDGVIGD